MPQLILVLSILFFSCKTDVQHEGKEDTTVTNKEIILKDTIKLNPISEFEREKIKVYIDSIQAVGGNLFVHCLVPLCDNDNQGIVPVSKSLGDGLSLRTNLYWATGHGMSGYFKKKSEWQTIKIYNPSDTNILQRAIFRSKVKNAYVYLINDAYRGDRMPECLDAYFLSLAGGKKDSVLVDSIWIKMNSSADMMAFNGHNGLMDTDIDEVESKDNRERDAIAIGCISEDYFRSYYFKARAYPLVMTTGLMYPGAFVLDDIIKKWAINSSELEMRYAAGDAYNRIMKCGQRGGRNLFSTGW